MKGYICGWCNKKRKQGEKFYPVLNGPGYYTPACSIECFHGVKERNVKEDKRNNEKVINQQPYAEIW